MPQLYLKLRQDPKLITNPLCRKLKLRLHNLNESRNYQFTFYIDEVDPFKNDLNEYVKEDEEKRLLSETKHLDLLYRYRNYLIHEFRTPGYGFELEHNKPYYSVFNSHFELVYSKLFILGLVKKGLELVKSHLLQNSMDPYQNHQFTPLWDKVY